MVVQASPDQSGENELAKTKTATRSIECRRAEDSRMENGVHLHTSTLRVFVASLLKVGQGGPAETHRKNTIHATLLTIETEVVLPTR